MQTSCRDLKWSELFDLLIFDSTDIIRTVSEMPQKRPSLYKEYEETTMSKTAIPRKPTRQFSRMRANLSMRSQEEKSAASIVVPAGRKNGESFKVRPSDSARRDPMGKRKSI